MSARQLAFQNRKALIISNEENLYEKEEFSIFKCWWQGYRRHRRTNNYEIQMSNSVPKNIIQTISDFYINGEINIRKTARILNNRASWCLKSLSNAYKQKFGSSISRSTISEYIRSQGYAFRKAKKVLTSPDPNYREKLQILQIFFQILQTNRNSFLLMNMVHLLSK